MIFGVDVARSNVENAFIPSVVPWCLFLRQE